MTDVDETLRTEALCRQMEDPDIWYADRGSEAHRVAKTICKECPVSQACLESGLRQKETWGLWGGLDEKERMSIGRGGRRLKPSVQPDPKPTSSSLRGKK